MTTDPAERLRTFLTYIRVDDAVRQERLADLDAALAAERRATVERIRAALEDRITVLEHPANGEPFDVVIDAEIQHALDAEAYR